MTRNRISRLLEKIRQVLEDGEDLLALFMRRNEPTIPHNQVLAELKADGLLKNWVLCRR